MDGGPTLARNYNALYQHDDVPPSKSLLELERAVEAGRLAAAGLLPPVSGPLQIASLQRRMSGFTKDPRPESTFQTTLKEFRRCEVQFARNESHFAPGVKLCAWSCQLDHCGYGRDVYIRYFVQGQPLVQGTQLTFPSSSVFLACLTLSMTAFRFQWDDDGNCVLAGARVPPGAAHP